MTISVRLKRLDQLIMEHTQPPVTDRLRSQIGLIEQDMEAIAQDVKLIKREVKKQKRLAKKLFTVNEKLLALNQKYLEAYGQQHSKS